MACRDIGRTCIDKLTVHFVREQEQVVFLYQIPYLVHFTPRIKIPRRIIRVANQDSFGPLVNQFFKLLYFRQRKPFLDGSCNRADNCPRRYGKCHVIRISRFGHNDFISRIQTTHESEQYGFRTACSHNDIIGIQQDVVLLIIPYKLLAIASVPLARAVFQNCTVYMANRFKGRSRSRKVWLTDIQVIYTNPSLLSSFCQWRQLANRRLRHFISSNGYMWHRIYEF